MFMRCVGAEQYRVIVMFSINNFFKKNSSNTPIRNKYY